MNKHYYKVYGLNIESEVLVPELTILEENEKDNIQVKIQYKPMPNNIKEEIKNGKIVNYEKQHMWFHIKDLATYYIYNGDTVLIETCENYDKQLLKVYILGSVMGLILLQRNIPAIHGGAIVIDGNGCVFTGDKGAGKSTLTTALRLKGYKFISDDVASINMGEQNMIYPGFGYQKLCDDAMTKLGYNTDEFEPFRSDFNIKYIVPALESFVDSEVPFKALFELEVGDVENVTIEEVTGGAKLQKLMKNIFRIEMLHYSGGVEPVYFKKCVDIAKNIKCYKIVRPKDKFTVDEQINLIEQIVNNLQKLD